MGWVHCAAKYVNSLLAKPQDAHPRSSSLWSAILRRMRRMILPDRVLGSPAQRHVHIFVKNGTPPRSRCNVVHVDELLMTSSVSDQQDAFSHLAPSG